MQFVYVQRMIPDFLSTLHKDDKGGALVRMTDAPSLGFPQALLVLKTAHDDDTAVQFFAEKLKDKMAASRDKGRGGWDQPSHGVGQGIAESFRGHLAKTNEGNYLDLAAFLMMLVQRGDQPDLIAAALEPTVDFTQDLVLESPCRPGYVQGDPITVSFDPGTTPNSMWVTQGDDRIAIDEPKQAVLIANYLLAWAHAESKLNKKETEA